MLSSWVTFHTQGFPRSIQTYAFNNHIPYIAINFDIIEVGPSYTPGHTLFEKPNSINPDAPMYTSRIGPRSGVERGRHG